MDSSEIRLRIVEALTRSDGSMARGNTVEFLQRVAQIETFVVKGPTTTADTDAASTPGPKPGRPPKKADKAPSFMD